MLEKLIQDYWRICNLLGSSGSQITFSEALFELKKIAAKAQGKQPLNDRVCQLITSLENKCESYEQDDFEKNNWFMDRPVELNRQATSASFYPAEPKQSSVRLDPVIVKGMSEQIFAICGSQPDEKELAQKTCWWIDGKNIIATTQYLDDDGEQVIFSISPTGLGPTQIGPWIETVG